MSIATGTYTGNGTHQNVSLAFEPEFLMVAPATAEFVGFKTPHMWCGRSNVLGADDSYISGAKLTGAGFTVGPAGQMNASGVTYHYLALARSAGLGMAFAGLQGNGASGRVVKLDDASITPAAVIGKRDSTRDGVLQIGANTTARLGGSANTEASAITSLSAGQFTVSSSVYVNEYNPGLELGEGMDFAAFATGSNVAATSYTGTGATNDVALGFQPKALIIAKLTGGVIAGRIKTDTMASDTAKVFSNGTALTSLGITITATGIQLSAGATANTSGETYIILAFKDHTEAATAAPAILRTGRQAILLPGRGTTSWIDCGTDNNLVKDGTITLEWMGGIEPIGRTTPTSMMWRGSGTGNTAGTCSFALYANGFVGSPGDWSGPVVSIGCSDRIDLSTSSTQIRTSWRTGLIAPFGDMVHWMVTHDGSGVWSLYKNGRLIRQRTLELVADASLPNIDGVIGHHMVLGAMYNSGAAVNCQRQRFMLARVYNRELTAAEVATRFSIAGLQSAATDVTSGLMEEWDAENASGTSLPATVNSANNGTITNGTILTL